jgi:hypothetical protein
MADKNARVPVRTFNVKDPRGRILHWCAVVGAVEGTGATEAEAVASVARILVNLAAGLDRTRLVRGEAFGTAIILPHASGWEYAMLRIGPGDGDGDPEERIRLSLSCTAMGYDTSAEAEAAAIEHAHRLYWLRCDACRTERKHDEIREWTTNAGAVRTCTGCLAGHGEVAVMRMVSEHVPGPAIHTWEPWRSSTEEG